MQGFIEAEFQPGPAVASDEELLDYARRRGGTVYHPTSTCKMGTDPMAVVDAELRVHGIEGLRVADASIMPTVVSGNTNAADDHDRREAGRHGAPSDAHGGLAVDRPDPLPRGANGASSGVAAASTCGYGCAKIPHVVTSRQGARPMTEKTAQSVANLGYHAHIYYDPTKTRAVAERVAPRSARSSRSRSKTSATRRAGRTRSPMSWLSSSPTSSSMSCPI